MESKNLEETYITLGSNIMELTIQKSRPLYTLLQSEAALCILVHALDIAELIFYIRTISIIKSKRLQYIRIPIT